MAVTGEMNGPIRTSEEDYLQKLKFVAPGNNPYPLKAPFRSSQDDVRVEDAAATTSGSPATPQMRTDVAILTGAADKPYALGLASALISRGVYLDFIGSDEVDGQELHNTPHVNFLNLRGEQTTTASRWKKTVRVLRYYVRLLGYVATARPRILHILWNNKFEVFDRTALMLYYRFLGKRIVLTAHNVNAGERDANDSPLNRLSLKIQYHLSDRIFVHTHKMKSELTRTFRVPEAKIAVIPFGINSTVPMTDLTTKEAKSMLGLEDSDKGILFFGNIAPYKGLEYLIEAMVKLGREADRYRLIIAGKVKGCEDYWRQIQATIAQHGIGTRIIQHIEFIPDEKTEVYFKAADVLVLPYTHIFQSGVLVLAYNFGLPVIAADVGSLREDVAEGKTGWVFRPKDSTDVREGG